MATPDRIEVPSAAHRALIARQPITNRRLGVYGYELLFRASTGGAGRINPTEATAQVLSSAILEVGLESLVLDRKAVINVTPAFLDVITEIQLDPGRIVLDLPDRITIDSDLIARLNRLRSLGYGLSVGGVANVKDPRLLPLATLFRIDVRHVERDRISTLLRFLRRYDDLSTLALKVESMQEFELYRDLGFDYLQGYFLGKPQDRVVENLPTSKLSVLHLLATVNNLDTPIEKLEQQISHNLSLSYKLLKLINSPFYGFSKKIDSVKQAVVLLGWYEIRKWVSLLALSTMSDEPPALMEVAVLRATLCERLAQQANLPKDDYFTVGLFSALDLLMKQPIGNILAKLPLKASVKEAIIGQQGMLGSALSCALAIENASWTKIDFANLDHEEFAEAYRNAIQTTAAIMRQV